MFQTRDQEQLKKDNKKLSLYFVVFLTLDLISFIFLIVCAVMSSFDFYYGIIVPICARPLVAFLLQVHKTMKWYSPGCQKILGKNQLIYVYARGKIPFYGTQFFPTYSTLWVLYCLIRLRQAKNGKRELPNWDWTDGGLVDWKNE